MVIIAIIGSRGDSKKHDTFVSYGRQIYDAMVFTTLEKIHSLGYRNHEVDLISGGCSFSDHIAITLFSMGKYTLNDPFKSLTIYSPCKWDKRNCQFYESASNQCGKILNSLHREFSYRINDRLTDTNRNSSDSSECSSNNSNSEYNNSNSNSNIGENTFNSLLDINETLQNSCVLFNDSNYTFFGRNTTIAYCADIIIAFGWSKDIESLEGGGTKYTIDQFNNKYERHYSKRNNIHYIDINKLK